MKRKGMREVSIALKVLSLVLAVGLVFTMAGMTSAWADTSRDEKKLEKEAAEINKTAGQPQGGAVVVQRLEKEFNVTESQITALRNQKMGYGEIAIVFSLAQKLSSTNNQSMDTNISTIMGYRQESPVMGWGEIAKKLGFKLGSVVSQVKKVETAATKEIKHQERTEHKMMKEERSEGVGKPDNMERPAAGQHGGGHTR